MAVAPPPAAAVLGLDVPSPEDLVEGIFKFLLERFFGVDAKVGRRAVEFLVAHPIYTDTREYPELATLRAYVTAGAWSIWALVVSIAALRYWASGFTSSGSYEAIQGMARGAGAAAALIAYPAIFGWLCVAGNLLTHALLYAPGVKEGMTKLLAGALTAGTPALGLGSIASAVAVILLVLLVVTKIVLATVLGILFVGGGLAIALWPLEETSWVARTWLQSLLAVLLWPVIWALCFAFFAVMGKAAFSMKGSFGKNLVEPWVTVAALWVAFHAPRMVARQAMSAGLSPSIGRSLATAMTVGRMGSRAVGAGGVTGRGAGSASGVRQAVKPPAG